MRLLHSDEYYVARMHKNSERHSIFAVNKTHGDVRGERFLGIAEGYDDAKMVLIHLEKAHTEMVKAHTLLRKSYEARKLAAVKK